MKKIDSHLHVNFHGFDVDTLIQYMNSENIEKCWLLSWEEENPIFSDLYKNLPIDDILKAYNKYPDRIIPFYAPDPGKKNWDSIMNEYQKKGVKGCGELKVTYKWTDKKIKIVLDTLERLHMPVVFHMEEDYYRFVTKKNNIVNDFLDKVLNGAFNGLTRKYIEKFIDKTGLYKESFRKHLSYFPGYMMDFTGLEYRLKQYPDVIFVAHGPAFWNHIEKNPDHDLTLAKGKVEEEGISVELLEKYDNLFVDTSGKSGFNALTRDTDFTKEFLDKFYDKIIFGTDNENDLPFEDVILNAGLSKRKVEKILVENAEELCD